MAPPEHNWYFREWCEALGKRQVDLVRDLGWNKSKASLMWRDTQGYTKQEVNELSAYLAIHPFELLMHPADAMALRRFRESASEVSNLALVADTTAPMATQADEVGFAAAIIARRRKR